jgi:histidine triad (HIT) family protein
MTNCLFCSIIKKEKSEHILYESESCLAFLDAKPINHGHALVIPKLHTSEFTEVPDSTLHEMISVAKRIALKLRGSSLGYPADTLLMHGGAGAGYQEIPHLHLHIVPRYPRDGFGWVFPEHYNQPIEHGEIHGIAEQIRVTIADMSRLNVPTL